MAYLVQKFGGTSVATPEKIQRAARHVLQAKQAGHQIAVVVSAMAKETDRLLALGRTFLPVPDTRELDVALATGEMLSASLMALALQSQGAAARSFLGFQLPILTTSQGGSARILAVENAQLLASFRRGEIPVIAGFQGVDAEGRLTTLGRGGSDTTAVAVAAALGGALCEIYTDVEGVYSADPRICDDAILLPEVSYPFMIEAAGLGAKVMHDRSVMMGMQYQVPITVKSTFSESPGTRIGRTESKANCVTLDLNVARISLIDEDPDFPLARALGELAVPYTMLGRTSERDDGDRSAVVACDPGRSLSQAALLCRRNPGEGIRHRAGRRKRGALPAQSRLSFVAAPHPLPRSFHGQPEREFSRRGFPGRKRRQKAP